MNRLAAPKFVVLAAAVFTIHAASAAEVYFYDGQPFSTATGPFLTTDSVAGFVQFAAAPAPLGTFDESDVSDYSFTAGGVTLTPATPGSGAVGSFTFDNLGQIATWVFTVNGFAPGSDNNLQELINTDWNGIDGDDFASIDGGSGGQAFNELTPGNWSRVPEPSSVLLLAAAAVLICRRPVNCR